jgi:putative flippase GtrA
LIKKAIALIRKLWSIQFIRFLVVGGINTVFGYAIFALFIVIGLHYVLAALSGQICGILFNFNTIGTIVFKNRDKRLLFRFFGVYLITYLLSIGSLRVFEIAGIGSLVAAAIMVLPVSFVGFLLMRRFVFKSLIGSQHKTD